MFTARFVTARMAAASFVFLSLAMENSRPTKKSKRTRPRRLMAWMKSLSCRTPLYVAPNKEIRMFGPMSMPAMM